MPVQVVRHLDEALDALAAMPRAEPIAGGTDLMVEINFGRRRVSDVVAIDRVDELKELRTGREFRVAAGSDTRIRIGGGVTYTQLLTDGAGSVALWEASRTVGSPQIRNAGTIGGNLGTASPAGDTLPVLAALDATVVLRSISGERRVKFTDFMTAPKKSVRRPDELIVAAEWDDAGPAQTYMFVSSRNAMAISIAGLALVVDRARRRVGAGLGSCAPTIIRPSPAERFATGLIDEAGWERTFVPSEATAKEFGRLVAAAAKPIDDVRGTAAYRRHALAVMGARALARVAAIV